MASILRTRLIEDLRIRNYSEKTVKIYVRCVALFAKYFGRSPAELNEEHVREYQHYLRREKEGVVGRLSIKQCVRFDSCTARY